MNKAIRTVIVGVFLFCYVVGVCGCTSHPNYGYIDMYLFEAKAGFESILKEHGFEDSYLNLTVEEYESIKDHLKEEDMYVYYHKCGNTETDKICQAFGYEGLDDFMIQKGYVDEDGEPSFEKFRDEAWAWMEQEIAERN